MVTTGLKKWEWKKDVWGEPAAQLLRIEKGEWSIELPAVERSVSALGTTQATWEE